MMAELGDFVWSDNCITSIDRLKRDPSPVYYWTGRSIGHPFRNKWEYLSYQNVFHSRKDSRLLSLADLECLIPFIRLPIHQNEREIKQFITELVVWCLNREA